MPVADKYLCTNGNTQGHYDKLTLGTIFGADGLGEQMVPRGSKRLDE